MGMASFGAGFVTGFGTGFLSRELFPIMKEIVRPVVKVSVKSGIKIYEKSREMMSRFGEVIEDSIAEVKQDLKADHRKKRGVVKRKTRAKAIPTEAATVTDISEIRGAV